MVVLIADDDDDVRELLVEAIDSMAGVRAVGARDGQEALEIAVASAPDVIVLDQRMPRMAGTEVIAALRARSVPSGVVLITAGDAAALAAQHDIAFWVRKPFSVDELKAVIQRALPAARIDT